MKKYVCIEGIIGSGKTTLTQQLVKYLYNKAHSVYALYENFQENKWLELFYQHSEKYNVLTEYSFLIDRFHQLHQHFQNFTSGITVSDFCFRKCLWFAKNNLNHQQFEEYQKHFLLLENDLNYSSDLIIFLNVTPAHAYQNIKKRNRSIENNLTMDYLEQLYSIYMHELSNQHKNVVFLNFVSYEQAFENLLTILKDKQIAL